jgi:hypothetical protein
MGQIAQYGRGSGMISEVSAELVSQFAENLRAKIRRPALQAGEQGAVPPGPIAQSEISVLGLVWKLFVAWCRRLFSGLRLVRGEAILRCARPERAGRTPNANRRSANIESAQFQ